MSNEEAAVNTDKEIWRRTADDYYSPSIHVTEDNGIGINVGGHVIVKPVEDWHKAGLEHARLRGFLETIISECAKPLEDFGGGYTQKNARIQVIAETALEPVPMTMVSK
jgi:hypothetical protein